MLGSPPPPPTEGMTHACENITLPQTSFAGGKNTSAVTSDDDYYSWNYIFQETGTCIKRRCSCIVLVLEMKKRIRIQMFVVEKSKAIQTLHCAICIFVAIILQVNYFLVCIMSQICLINGTFDLNQPGNHAGSTFVQIGRLACNIF